MSPDEIKTETKTNSPASVSEEGLQALLKKQIIQSVSQEEKKETKKEIKKEEKTSPLVKEEKKETEEVPENEETEETEETEEVPENEETEETEETEEDPKDKAIKELTERLKKLEEKESKPQERVVVRDLSKLDPITRVNTCDNFEELEEARKDALAIKHECLRNPEGTQQNSKKAIQSALAKAERILDEVIPARKEFLAIKADSLRQVRDIWGDSYHDQKTELGQFVTSARNEPWAKELIKNLPNSDHVIGLVFEGLKIIKARKAEASKKDKTSSTTSTKRVVDAHLHGKVGAGRGIAKGKNTADKTIEKAKEKGSISSTDMEKWIRSKMNV